MKITLRRFSVTKRHALAISRGTSAGSENLLVEVEHDGVVGMGEMAPTSGGAVAETAETAEADLLQWRDLLVDTAPWEMQRIDDVVRGSGGHAAHAALDIALHDWLGKRAGMPLWRLFGLEIARIPPTSLTIGINPPDVLREIIPEILARTGARALKVKLGNPAGIDADQESFAAVQEAAGYRPGAPSSSHSAPEAGGGDCAGGMLAAGAPILWRVDANGGWTPGGARTMIAWLAERGVEFVEQPLPRGQELDLPAVHRGSPLPIYADESIYHATDIPPLAACIDGVNLKLMKCGGLREALRIIHAARAHGLKVMMGCMSESSLAITAASHLSPLADALDLDSHLNLRDDPFRGATYHEGRVVPNDLPGLGVEAKKQS